MCMYIDASLSEERGRRGGGEGEETSTNYMLLVYT